MVQLDRYFVFTGGLDRMFEMNLMTIDFIADLILQSAGERWTRQANRPVRSSAAAGIRILSADRSGRAADRRNLRHHVDPKLAANAGRASYPTALFPHRAERCKAARIGHGGLLRHVGESLRADTGCFGRH